MSSSNEMALAFKALHKPGSPLILTNVYDLVSAEAVAALPSCKAIASASYAIARAAGTVDESLTLETNLAAVKLIARAAKAQSKPFTVDIQDAYGERLEEAINAVIDVGAVGVNLEDVDKESQKQHAVDVAVSRIHRTLAVAKARGVPDFVVNARCDTLLTGGKLDDTIQRGKAYLAAGATTVFVFGGPVRGGITKEEVASLSEAFGGLLNVSLSIAPDGLSIAELKELRVARISMGPTLQFTIMAKFAQDAESYLAQA